MGTRPKRLKSNLIANRNVTVGSLAAFVVVFAIIGIHLLFHSHAATAVTQTVPVCGERQPSDLSEYTGPPVQANSSNVAIAGLSSQSFQAKDFVLLAGSGGRPDEWYVRDQGVSATQDTFRIYNATNNTLVSTFYVPQTGGDRDVNTESFAVDPSGNIYFATKDILMSDGTTNGERGKYLYKYTPTSSGLATQDWAKALNTGPTSYAVYTYTDNTSRLVVGAVVTNPSATNTWDPAGSELFDTNGNNIGVNSVVGTDINYNPATKDIVSAENVGGNATVADNVIIYGNDGSQKFSMGAPLYNTQPGPFHWQQLAAAAELPNGDIVVADSGQNVGLEYFSGTGNYIGLIQNNSAQPRYGIDNVEYETNLVIYNGAIYYVGNNGLENITLSSAQNAIGLPQGAPFQMGIGAGLFTSATDNYFPTPAGGTASPSVSLRFYQWWQAQAANYTGSYTVRSIQQILNGQTGTPVSFSIPGLQDSSAYTNGHADLSIQGLPTTPGVYEVNAQLLQNGTVVGASCVDYTVGAPNVSYTPPSSMTGGADTSGLTTAVQLGQKLFRSTYTLGDCLPSGTSSLTSSTPLSCPASMDSDVAAAAKLAIADGVTYEMQLVGGSYYGLDGTGLSNGQFQRLATALMTHFDQVTKDQLNEWECWNEPDNSYPGYTMSTYVNGALEQCHAAAVAANAADSSANNKVIGFSNDGDDPGAIQSFIGVGGLQYANIVSIHTYTAHNSSFEEEGNIIPSIYNLAGETTGISACDTAGTVGQVQCDQTLLSNAGYRGPLFDTESGYSESDGGTAPDPYDFYNQGDKLVRKMILEQSVGMNWLSNFYNVGSFPVGTYWALIGGPNGEAVNPGALAALNYQTDLGGRAFLTWLPTGVPHTYAAEYGTSSTSNTDVVAIWSDDYNVNVVPKLSTGGTIAVTSEYGATSTVTSGQNLSLTGQVQYLAVPNGATLAVTPQETYGTNYSTISNQASVSSSSNYAGNPNQDNASNNYTPDHCANPNNANPNVVLYGIDDSEGKNYICQGRLGTVWAPKYDPDPSVLAKESLTINFNQAKTIDRVFVSSFSLGSSLTGLRNYTVEANTGTVGSPNWVTVAQATNLFFDRNNLLTFPAQLATQIKLTNFAINYSGTSGGLPPTWWSNTSDEVAPVYDVEAYGPGSGGPVAPQPPTGLQVVGTPTYNQVNLSWTASTDPGGPGIGGYYILRNGAVIGNSPGKGTTYSDTTVQPSTNYTYSVEAYDTNKVVSGVSGSVPAITPPAPVNLQPPTGLSATSNSPTQINLTWTGSTGATGYYVLRQDPGATTFTTVGQVSGTTDTDTGLVANTTYTYEIEAFDGNGDVSGPSTQASATTLKPIAPPPPTQPTGLQATGTSNTQINLTWTASSSSTGVAGYDIYRVTGTNPPTVSSADLIGSSPTNSYGDTGLSAGTTYTYVVVAYDNSVPPQASPASPPATGSTLKSLKPDEITGVITTKKTGLGIVGAKVTGGDSWTTANSSGVYALTNLGNGTRYYYYFAKGYTTQSILIKLTTTNPTVTKNVALEK